MFNLFNKGPKVRAGKQNNEKEKPAAAAANAQAGGKKPARFGALGGAWKKLNSMDRKQAYTWGAVAVVALVALLTLGSAVGSSSKQDDFSDFETRGYDLANMPFSSDEAEQYLLASKYPDLKDKNASGLYSKEEKEARQAEDAEKAAELDASASSNASQYVPGRYYGGGAGGGSPTQVGSLNSANLKGASGSGISGTFGPSGDFSNFRTQEKGGDKFTPQGPGSGDARKALFQAAMGSRAAAGLKNDKLLNAKKAMMGGNIKGSGAFMDDSGAVSLKDSKGLELDTNAPVSSADLSGLDDGLQDAKDAAEDEAREQDEKELWQVLLEQFATKILDVGMNLGQQWLGNKIAVAQQTNAYVNAKAQEEVMGQWNATVGADNASSSSKLGGSLSFKELNTLSDKELKKLNITKTGADDKAIFTAGETTITSQSTDPLTLGSPKQQKQLAKINSNRYDAYYSNYKNDNPGYFASLKAQGKMQATAPGYNFNYNNNNNGGQQIFSDAHGKYVMVDGTKHYLAE